MLVNVDVRAAPGPDEETGEAVPTVPALLAALATVWLEAILLVKSSASENIFEVAGRANKVRILAVNS